MDRKLERLFIGKVRAKSRGLTNVDVFERIKAERDIKFWEEFPRHADTQVKRRRLNNTEVAQALLLEDKVANVTVATHGKTHSLNILITKPCEKHVMVELNNANLQFFKEVCEAQAELESPIKAIRIPSDIAFDNGGVEGLTRSRGELRLRRTVGGKKFDRRLRIGNDEMAAKETLLGFLNGESVAKGNADGLVAIDRESDGSAASKSSDDDGSNGDNCDNECD